MSYCNREAKTGVGRLFRSLGCKGGKANTIIRKTVNTGLQLAQGGQQQQDDTYGQTPGYAPGQYPPRPYTPQVPYGQPNPGAAKESDNSKLLLIGGGVAVAAVVLVVALKK